MKKKKEIKFLIADENLDEAKALRFIENCFRDGFVRTTGTEIGDMLPPMSMFGEAAKKRALVRARVVEKIEMLFEKYYGV